jgi:hypothetical protein
LQLKGDNSVTLFKHLNHKLFDLTDSVSFIVQRRQAALAAQNAVAPPVINFQKAFNFLHPLIQQPPAAVVNPIPSIQLSVTLLPPTHLPGPDMTLNTFCTTHGLSPKIIEKFMPHDYLHVWFLHFILITELTDMGFAWGEIATLWDAAET